jgi:anti-sigma factor RsiW
VNHRRAQGLLSSYLERDLGDAERAAVEAHAAACEACGADLEELRDTIAMLRRLPAPEPPPFLAARVMARIRDGEAQTAGWRQWLGNLAAPAVAAPLAALAAAAAVVVLASPPRETVVASARPEAAQGLAIVPRPVGPVPSGTLVAAAGQPGAGAHQVHQIARRLRGAGHPHSRSLAAHFDRPAEAIAVSWSGR